MPTWSERCPGREASNFGPSQARARFHGTEDAADSAISSLECEYSGSSNFGSSLAQGGVASARSPVCCVVTLLHPRQTPTGRKGWKSFVAPVGWVQVIRGPSPPSVQWPRVGQQQVRQSATGRVVAPSKPEPRQLLADHNTQQPKHQPGSKTSGLRPFTDPATKVSDAKERVVKLERVLATMEGIDGSEVDSVREALERAKKAAQTPPVETQIRDCEQFLSELKHIWRQSMPREPRWWQVSRMAPLESLKVLQQNQPPPVPDTSSEVQRLQAMVAQLQSQLVQVAGPTSMTLDNPSSKRARLLEDYVPSCVEEMQQWVWDRQQDLQAATIPGRPEEVERISQLIIRGAQEWHGVQAEQTTVGSGPGMLPSTVGLMVR